MAAHSRTRRVDFLIMFRDSSFLPPLPPDGDARYQHDTREEYEVEPTQQARLGHGQRDGAIGLLLRANRYLALILREPIDCVEKKIAIVLHVDPLIRSVGGVADHNQ